METASCVVTSAGYWNACLQNSVHVYVCQLSRGPLYYVVKGMLLFANSTTVDKLWTQKTSNKGTVICVGADNSLA